MKQLEEYQQRYERVMRTIQQQPRRMIVDIENHYDMIDDLFQSNQRLLTMTGTNETITKTFADKMKNYKEFIQNRESVYSMIFKELDDLFFGLMY